MRDWIVVTACALGVFAPAQAQAKRPASEADHVRLEHVRVVALDPGHGGDNRGCLGADGTREKKVVLAISKRVERILLEETSATPLMTRREDVFLGLRERTRMANAWDADLFLSIHLNADEHGRGQGVEAWFLTSEAASEEAEQLVLKEEAAYADDVDLEHLDETAVGALLKEASMSRAQVHSEVLAEEVAKALHKGTGWTFRGVKQARFTVLKEARMPAVVVEAGFLSHHEQGLLLLRPDVQERIARSIVDAIIAYDRRMGGSGAQAALR